MSLTFDFLPLFQSWTTWSDWLKTANPSAKLVLGVPASPSAAGSGYIPQDTLINTVLPFIKKSSNYGGVMMWSAFYDINNLVKGQPYSVAIKSNL